MKILIIGFGSIGKKYFHILSKQKADIAIYDTNLKILHKKKINILKTFSDIKKWQPDGIIISNPSNKHVDTLKKYLSLSPKSFLIEKPLDISFKKVIELDKLELREKKKIFIVNNIEYFLPIKYLLKYKKQLGKIYFSNILFGHNLNYMRKINSNNFLKKKKSGGIVLDCIHELMYSYCLFGSIKKINIEKYKISKLKTNFPDMVKINFLHQKNIFSFIHLDYFQEIKNRGCEIFGNKGTIFWRVFGKQKINNQFRIITKKKGTEYYKNVNFKININDQYYEMLKDWLYYMKFGKEKKLRNLSKTLKFYKSLKKIFNEIS